jgi:hypothetical protein
MLRRVFDIAKLSHDSQSASPGDALRMYVLFQATFQVSVEPLATMIC